MTWGKLLCTWCEREAITTVVHMKACKQHHDMYHHRRQAGESWAAIEHDFWRERWADEGRRRASQVSP